MSSILDVHALREVSAARLPRRGSGGGLGRETGSPALGWDGGCRLLRPRRLASSGVAARGRLIRCWFPAPASPPPPPRFPDSASPPVIRKTEREKSPTERRGGGAGSEKWPEPFQPSAGVSPTAPSTRTRSRGSRSAGAPEGSP